MVISSFNKPKPYINTDVRSIEMDDFEEQESS